MAGTANQTATDVTRLLTQYFIAVQERANLKDHSFANIQHIQVPLSQVRSGKLNEHDVAQLRSFVSSAPGAKKRKDDQPIDLIISLITLRENSKHEGLLLLPATLEKDGSIAVDMTSSPPWIPASRMTSPGTIDRSVMVGPLRNYWTFLLRRSQSLLSNVASVGDAVDYAYRMYQAVESPAAERLRTNTTTGHDPTDAHHVAERKGMPPHTAILESTCFICVETIINANKPILELLTHLADHADHAPLYRRVVGLNNSPKTPAELISATPDALMRNALEASGSMSADFPLTRSQRRALHAFLNSEDGDVTAVSGPPGTGKTTLLQSVVATLIVQHALAGHDAPLIVGTSTNNQAVTNIIDSFASVTPKQPGTLDHRWLPAGTTAGTAADGAKADGATALATTAGAATAGKTEPLASLAAYCPSSAKMQAAQAKGYLTENAAKTGVYTQFSSPEYLDAASSYYSECVRASKLVDLNVLAGPNVSFGDVAAQLRQLLAQLDEFRKELLRSFIPAASRKHPHQVFSFFDAFGAPPASEQQASLQLLSYMHFEGLGHFITEKDASLLTAAHTLAELDQALDTTLRYYEFWLAIHHYEARWLDHITGNLLDSDERKKNTKHVMDTYWGAVTALTPCFVMTAYQLPRYFRLWDRDNGANPNYNAIDLLIVDEAGQVDTTLGAAGFSLAKRAMVVGDVRQLAPVWSIDPESDRELGAAHGLGSCWDSLVAAGLTGSLGSSLMAAASQASSWKYGKPGEDDSYQPGLFLSEHFRCHTGIISYCNDLIYKGMLEPKRPSDGWKLRDVVDHPLLFRTVANSQDQREGSSRSNRSEAEAIVEWIEEHNGYFAELYATGDASPIGVVTPFKSQANLIKRLLWKQSPALARQVTVGTAHTLQGAERPIILFSCVYGEKASESPFIENTHELMNVAVSRAKDLFIVFGAKTRLKDPGKVFTLLRAHSQPCPEPLIKQEAAEEAPEAEAEETSEPAGEDAPVPESSASAAVKIQESAADTHESGAEEAADAGRASCLDEFLYLPTVDRYEADAGNGVDCAVHERQVTAAAYAAAQEAYFPQVAFVSASRLIAMARDLGVPVSGDMRAVKLNKRLEHAGLIARTEAGWHPTSAGKEAGIRTKLTESDGEYAAYCVYSVGALARVAEFLR